MPTNRSRTRVQIPNAESLYLDQLTFDPSLRGSWIEVLFRNTRLLLLLIFAVIVFGLFAFFSLPKELNPEVTIPVVSVVTALPGASPRDVESLITEKVEKISTNLPNLDTVTSQSTQGVSVVSFQFASSQDLDEALRVTKEEVDLLQDELPEDAVESRVQKLDINDQAFLILSLTGDTGRYNLSKIARELEDDLEQINGVKQVALSGQEEEEIVISLKPETLQLYNLTESSIVQALKSSNITLPSGDIKVGDAQYTVSVDSEFKGVEEVRALPVKVDGVVFPLGQLADVYQRTKEISRVVSYKAKDQPTNPAVQLAIFKSENVSITEADDRVQETIKQVQTTYPGVKVEEVINFTDDIRKTFTDLQGNFSSSITLMFIVLLIFLGLRQASVAALSIPLVILCSFIGMQFMGLSLNFLSLFSLLLALSLIGDDAIVMAQSTTSYGKKFGPHETGLLVFRDFFVPIWVGTLTVVWSFVPLLLSTGIIGSFIRPIPLVVTATLLSSTAIATLLNLPLNVILREATIPKRVKTLLYVLGALLGLALVSVIAQNSPFQVPVIITYVIVVLLTVNNLQNLQRWWMQVRKKLHQRTQAFTRRYQKLLPESAESSLVSLRPVVNWYRERVEGVVEHRQQRLMVFAAVGILLLTSFFFVATGALKSEFFPQADSNSFMINIEGPVGQNRDLTAQVTEQVVNTIAQVPEVVNQQITIGETFSGDMGSGGSGDNVSTITVNLLDMEERKRTSTQIAADLRQSFSTVTAAKVTVVEISGGPPAGAVFQANIKGESLEELERIAKDFQKYLAEIPGTINIDNSLKLSPGQVTVVLNQYELAERGLSSVQVAGWLRTAISGNNATDVIIAGEETEVTLELAQDQKDLETLPNLVLPSSMGSYTLSEVATFKLENSPSSITREDGRRVVRVTAGGEGISGPEILRAFQEKAQNYPLPPGYTWDVGGVNEENQKSVNSIVQAMGVSFFLILVTMVLQLHSFRKALLVVGVIPLALIGVIINFTLFGIPLSFPALIGVLSLFGIVVNNALMVMDKINLNLEYKFPVKLAVIDGTASRVEAIFLSSLAAIVGLLPVTISDPLWRGLGGAIIAGLTVSGFLILFLVPALYMEVFGEKTTDEAVG